MQAVFEGGMLIGTGRIGDVAVNTAEALFECVRKTFGMPEWIGNQRPGLGMYGCDSLFNGFVVTVAVADGELIAAHTVPFGRFFVASDLQIDIYRFSGDYL